MSNSAETVLARIYRRRSVELLFESRANLSGFSGQGERTKESVCNQMAMTIGCCNREASLIVDGREMGDMKTTRTGILTGWVLLAMCCVARGEETPRDLCAFVDLGQAVPRPTSGKRDASSRVLGADVRAVQGVTFDLRGGCVSLRAGERIGCATNTFVYAGQKSMESMTQHDMGPLVFYAVQTVYLLHGVAGDTTDRRVGRLEFAYEDGTTNSEDLILGENIGSSKISAEWAKMAVDGLCVTEVLNPVPYGDLTYEPGKGHGLKSLTIVITNRDVVYRLAAMTCKLGRQKVHE
jgi:hypothetical protein